MTKSISTLTRRQAIAVMGLAAAGGWAQAAESTRAIILCYSRTGNTLRLARALQKETNAELVVIEPKEPYAESYNAMTHVARDEKQRRARREIKTAVPDLADYDTVYLGTPYWWGGMAVPMWTFVSDHPMAGKTIRPFFTSGSSSPDGAMKELKELCPQAALAECFHADSGSLATAETDIAVWAKGLAK